MVQRKGFQIDHQGKVSPHTVSCIGDKRESLVCCTWPFNPIKSHIVCNWCLLVNSTNCKISITCPMNSVLKKLAPLSRKQHIKQFKQPEFYWDGGQLYMGTWDNKFHHVEYGLVNFLPFCIHSTDNRNCLFLDEDHCIFWFKPKQCGSRIVCFWFGPLS